MYLGESTVTLKMIPSGVPGIIETLKEMSRLVRSGKKDLLVRQAASNLTSHCDSGNSKNYACQVRVLHAFVRDHIRYLLDPHNAEWIQAPDKTLEMRSGDCDDKSILLAALLESLGHPTRFVAIGFEPGVYSHVYVETKIGTRWIPLETTEQVEAGWEPDASIVRERKYHYN